MPATCRVSTVTSQVSDFVGSLALAAVIVAAVTGFFHYVKVGPVPEPEDEDDVAAPAGYEDGSKRREGEA